MKRFIGLFLAFGGAAASLWGAYHALLGQTSTRLEITHTFSMSAMAVGLTGLAVFTVGLLWVRD